MWTNPYRCKKNTSPMDDLWKVSACTKTFSYQCFIDLYEMDFFSALAFWRLNLRVANLASYAHPLCCLLYLSWWSLISDRLSQEWLAKLEAILFKFASRGLRGHTILISHSKTYVSDVRGESRRDLRTSKLDFKYYTSFTPWLITEFFKMLLMPYL